jgi:hypothetical protein
MTTTPIQYFPELDGVVEFFLNIDPAKIDMPFDSQAVDEFGAFISDEMSFREQFTTNLVVLLCQYGFDPEGKPYSDDYENCAGNQTSGVEAKVTVELLNITAYFGDHRGAVKESSDSDQFANITGMTELDQKRFRDVGTVQLEGIQATDIAADNVASVESQHWLMKKGCNADGDADTAAGYANDADALGYVQCCATSGGACERKDGATVCFTNKSVELTMGDGLKTFAEAEAICTTQNMQLCTREELVRSTSSGCCLSGCDLDTNAVWTSTLNEATGNRRRRAVKTKADVYALYNGPATRQADWYLISADQFINATEEAPAQFLLSLGPLQGVSLPSGESMFSINGAGGQSLAAMGVLVLISIALVIRAKAAPDNNSAWLKKPIAINNTANFAEQWLNNTTQPVNLDAVSEAVAFENAIRLLASPNVKEDRNFDAAIRTLSTPDFVEKALKINVNLPDLRRVSEVLKKRREAVAARAKKNSFLEDDEYLNVAEDEYVDDLEAAKIIKKAIAENNGEYLSTMTTEEGEYMYGVTGADDRFFEAAEYHDPTEDPEYAAGFDSDASDFSDNDNNDAFEDDEYIAVNDVNNLDLGTDSSGSESDFSVNSNFGGAESEGDEYLALEDEEQVSALKRRNSFQVGFEADQKRAVRHQSMISEMGDQSSDEGGEQYTTSEESDEQHTDDDDNSQYAGFKQVRVPGNAEFAAKRGPPAWDKRGPPQFANDGSSCSSSGFGSDSSESDSDFGGALEKPNVKRKKSARGWQMSAEEAEFNDSIAAVDFNAGDAGEVVMYDESMFAPAIMNPAASIKQARRGTAAEAEWNGASAALVAAGGGVDSRGKSFTIASPETQNRTSSTRSNRVEETTFAAFDVEDDWNTAAASSIPDATGAVDRFGFAAVSVPAPVKTKGKRFSFSRSKSKKTDAPVVKQNPAFGIEPGGHYYPGMN